MADIDRDEQHVHHDHPGQHEFQVVVRRAGDRPVEDIQEKNQEQDRLDAVVAFGDDPALIQHDNGVGEGIRLLQVLGGQEYGRADADVGSFSLPYAESREDSMALAMALLKTVGSVVLIAGVTGIAMGLWGSARDVRSTQAVWDALLTQREPEPESYDPAMVADLPEIAQRYFANAIAPGTPLHRVARLEMEGSLILNGREMPMHADQILAPAHGFVWRARAGSGAVRFSGSDGYRAGQTSWTRFWLWGVLPVARIADTEDHARAAAARVVLEAVWVPPRCCHSPVRCGWRQGRIRRRFGCRRCREWSPFT